MTPRVFTYFFLTGLLVISSLWSGSSKPTGGLRVHLQIGGPMEATSQTASVPLTDPDETITVSTLPDLTEAHITEVRAIPNGEEMGMFILFNAQGKTILQNVTLQGQGRIMIVFLNDRIVYSPVIDSVISDGSLVIPSGVTPKDLEMMQSLAKKNQGK